MHLPKKNEVLSKMGVLSVAPSTIGESSLVFFKEGICLVATISHLNQFSVPPLFALPAEVWPPQTG